MLDVWLYEPTWKQVIIDTYGIDMYHRIELDAVALFPAYVSARPGVK